MDICLEVRDGDQFLGFCSGERAQGWMWFDAPSYQPAMRGKELLVASRGVGLT